MGRHGSNARDGEYGTDDPTALEGGKMERAMSEGCATCDLGHQRPLEAGGVADAMIKA